MGDDTDQCIKTRHSFYVQQARKPSGNSEKCCKSDINVVIPKLLSLTSSNIRKRDTHPQNSIRNLREYYKKYEHDEVPVKDLIHQDHTNVGDKISLTNSELDKLELKIFKNMSQELQTDDNSITCLESNIKLFKTTVLEIFDNFYASMRDFELYKKRFHEILAKNKEEAIADMEEFIKDMIQHIMTSETSISNESRKSNDLASLEVKDQETNISGFDDNSSLKTQTNSEGENLNSLYEAYKNDNYLTDSTLDETKGKHTSKKEEIFNIYLLSGNPCVQIKMNDRNLLSEINIKEPCPNGPARKHVASAENMERLAAKRMELEKYVEQQQDANMPDREIPVKVSYAKKNIYLDEDFSHERDSEKSLISKICNFLCRKFRKTS